MASTPTNKIKNTCFKCGSILRKDNFCVSCYYIQLKPENLDLEIKPLKHRHVLSEINIEDKTAICKECGLVKIIKRDQTKWRCSVSTNERSKLYKRAYRASKKKIMKSNCEICGSIENLCYDHSHKTNKYRGTLCNSCNLAIGIMRDDIERLKNAIKYLENERN
jgi:hypothetical protein